MSGKTSVSMRWAQFGFILGIIAVVPTPVRAQSNPFVGTWTLNIAKSRFSPGPAPKNQVAVYEAVAGGYHVTATGVDGAGKPIRTEYTAMTDGKDYPVTGSADYDTISLKQASPRSLAFTRKKTGKVVQMGTIVVSADGKTRTVSATGTNSAGIKVRNVSVYDKQ